MRILPATPQAIDEAIAIIAEGGIVAHATETCYGLACDLSNPVAVAKLFAIKQRPNDQPVSALFADVNQAKEFVEWNERAEELAIGLPGPLTIVLPLRATAKLFPTPHGGATIGIRVSPHPTARALVTEFGSPISTTSANIHGKPNPYSAADIVKQFAGLPDLLDLILDDGVLPSTPPSTVIDLTRGEGEILRP